MSESGERCRKKKDSNSDRSRRKENDDSGRCKKKENSENNGNTAREAGRKKQQKQVGRKQRAS